MKNLEIKKVLENVEYGRLGKMDENNNYQFELENLNEEQFELITNIVVENDEYFEKEDEKVYFTISQRTLEEIKQNL